MTILRVFFLWIITITVLSIPICLAQNTTAVRTTTGGLVTNTTKTNSTLVLTSISSTTTKAKTSMSTSTTTTSTTTKPCSSGYEFVNGSCKDIDECNIVDRMTCNAGVLCKNLPGGFICYCPSRTLRRNVSGPGIGCYYVIPMTQLVYITNGESMRNTSSQEYINFIRDMRDNYEGFEMFLFSENWIAVQEIFANSVLFYIELLTSDSRLTPSEIQRLCNNTMARNIWRPKDVDMDLPSPVSSVCVADLFQSREVANRTFQFPTTKSGSSVNSVESCNKNGYGASIRCKTRILADGNGIGFFDSDTLKERKCNRTSKELVELIETTDTDDPIELEEVTDVVAQLSKELSPNSSTEDVKALTKTINALANDIDLYDIPVTEASLEYMMYFADTLYDTAWSALSEGNDLLDTEDEMAVIDALENYASHLYFEEENVTIRTGSNVFRAQKIKCSSPRDMDFDDATTDTDPVFQRRVSTVIPASAIPANCSTTINAVFFIYKDDTYFPRPSGSNQKIHQILSTQLAKVPLKGLKKPITHGFQQPPRDNGTEKNFVVHRCAYLDVVTSSWKFDGCTTTTINPGMTSCDCDHTTNFAVIVQTHNVSSSFALSIVGYIGCSLSALSLILVVVIYVSFSKLRTNQINQLHIHLSSCLAVAYLTFIFGVQRPRTYAPCMFVGSLLQFTLLSSWGWMLAECVTMYKKFVLIFGVMSSKYVTVTSVVVYTLSLMATAFTVIVAYVTGDLMMYENWASATDNDPLFHPSYYVSDRLCWLHGYSLYFGFLVPVALMFLANIGGFIKITMVLTRSKDEIRSTKAKRDDFKDHAFRVMTVSVLLGVSWIFAIPLTLSNDPTVNEVFSWLFSISNAFQGVFIFLLFCVKRKDVRVLWVKRLPQISSLRTKKYDLQAAAKSTGVEDSFNTQTGAPSTSVTYKSLAESRDNSPYLGERKIKTEEISLGNVNGTQKISPLTT